MQTLATTTHPATSDMPIHQVPTQGPGKPIAQGDVTVIPEEMAERNGATISKDANWRDCPPAGITVVGGIHPHALYGGCRWTTDVIDSTGLAVGAVNVISVTVLDHPEHGQTILAEGLHVIRRSREMAAEIRRVAD